MTGPLAFRSVGKSAPFSLSPAPPPLPFQEKLSLVTKGAVFRPLIPRCLLTNMQRACSRLHLAKRLGRIVGGQASLSDDACDRL